MVEKYEVVAVKASVGGSRGYRGEVKVRRVGDTGEGRRGRGGGG